MRLYFQIKLFKAHSIILKFLSFKTISWHKSMEVLVAQLWLCDPVDCSPPGSSLCGIFQVRVLGWIAISFSRGSSWPRDQTWVSCIAGRVMAWYLFKSYILCSSQKYQVCILCWHLSPSNMMEFISVKQSSLLLVLSQWDMGHALEMRMEILFITC